MIKSCFVGFMLAALSISASAASENILKLYVSNDRIAMVSDPERVEICMLKVSKPWFSDRRDKIRYIESDGRPLKFSEITFLKEKMTSEASFGWDYVKGCMPTYNARAKFYRDGHVLSIDYCFGCNIFLLSFDGVAYSGEDFDKIRSDVLSLFKKYFSDDPIIHKIENDEKQKANNRALIEEAKKLEKEKAGKK